MKNRKNILRAVVAGFILAAVWSIFPFAAVCGQLPESIIRLHVKANSDSEQDQAVKLLVRDAVLKEAEKWYSGAENIEEANSLICLHMGSLKTAAENVLRENGFDDTATVCVTDMYFPTRSYEKFTLPAGKYRALKVTVGEGKGENWWCVIYPSLCLPSSMEQAELLTESQRDVVENHEKYRVRFKAVELYERLRELLDAR